MSPDILDYIFNWNWIFQSNFSTHEIFIILAYFFFFH